MRGGGDDDDKRNAHHGGGKASKPELTRLVEQDNIPWFQKPNLRGLYLVMIPACLGVEATSGYDSSMLNGLQLVSTWRNYFHNPESAILGLMSAMYSLGAIFSLPFVPVVSDRLGRKMGIVFGSMFMVLGALLQGFSKNIAMFVCARFILGFGIPFAIISASSLIGELSYPKERATLGSMFNASYFPGAIVAAGVTLGTFSMPNNWGWRIPSLLQIIPSVLQLTFIWSIPESPRWLVSKGRHEEARAILVRYHAEGDENSELVRVEFAQIENTLAIELENSKRSWKELVMTSGMRRRVLIGSFLGLATQWSGNGLTSYFLGQILTNVGVTNDRTKNLINLGNSCWGCLNATLLAIYVHKLRRRTAYLTCTISLLLIFTGWTAASAVYAETKSQASSKAVIAFIFLYSPAYNIGYNALSYTYLVELFPFAVRARGIAIFQWWGRGAGFFNQFVNPIGIKNASWKYYISYIVVLVIEVIFVYFLFPETANRSLEELAFLFEDKDREKQEKKVIADIRDDHDSLEKTSRSE